MIDPETTALRAVYYYPRRCRAVGLRRSACAGRVTRAAMCGRKTGHAARAPRPPWSVMSNGVETATRSPSSGASRRRCHPRATVAGAAYGDRPHYYPHGTAPAEQVRAVPLTPAGTAAAEQPRSSPPPLPPSPAAPHEPCRTSSARLMQDARRSRALDGPQAAGRPDKSGLLGVALRATSSIFSRHPTGSFSSKQSHGPTGFAALRRVRQGRPTKWCGPAVAGPPHRVRHSWSFAPRRRNAASGGIFFARSGESDLPTGFL